jgi:two-component system LytT family response regulator
VFQDDGDAGFRPPVAKAYLTRIPVRSMNRIVIVPVLGIARLEAEDNYVRIFADRPYLHKQTLTGLLQRLDPAEFLRVHRSHAVNIRLVRELRPQLHGEYGITLTDGTELTSGRSYRGRIQEAFGLTRGGDA